MGISGGEGLLPNLDTHLMLPNFDAHVGPDAKEWKPHPEADHTLNLMQPRGEAAAT